VYVVSRISLTRGAICAGFRSSDDVDDVCGTLCRDAGHSSSRPTTAITGGSGAKAKLPSVCLAFEDSKQPASDSHLFGFFCSFIDLQDFGVPVEALNIIFIDISIAAMHLKSLVADPHGHLAGKIFCHGVQ
jgi:hypothetical protein